MFSELHGEELSHVDSSPCQHAPKHWTVSRTDSLTVPPFSAKIGLLWSFIFLAGPFFCLFVFLHFLAQISSFGALENFMQSGVSPVGCFPLETLVPLFSRPVGFHDVNLCFENFAWLLWGSLVLGLTPMTSKSFENFLCSLSDLAMSFLWLVQTEQLQSPHPKAEDGNRWAMSAQQVGLQPPRGR